ALTGAQVLLAPKTRPGGDFADAFVSALSAARTREQHRHIGQIVRLGCQTPEERLCSLFLELHERLSRVGLGDTRRLPMPLSQQILAELIGISAVHVNRTLRSLRNAGLLEIKSGVITLDSDAIGNRFAHLSLVDA
ncbi:MAG: helix-turn-helix domain-containing protein, partial [Brevundimonas sp.]